MLLMPFEKCSNSEHADYGYYYSKEIDNPFTTALKQVTGGFFYHEYQCFGHVSAVDDLGWSLTITNALQEQSYIAFFIWLKIFNLIILLALFLMYRKIKR